MYIFPIETIIDLPPSVRTVLPPSATRVKAAGSLAAATALAKPAMAARENFILNLIWIVMESINGQGYGIYTFSLRWQCCNRSVEPVEAGETLLTPITNKNWGFYYF